MRPIVTDVLWSVYLSVCVADITESRAKAAELIEMPCGEWECGLSNGPKEPCITWRIPIPSGEGAILGAPLCDAAFRQSSIATCCCLCCRCWQRC